MQRTQKWWTRTNATTTIETRHTQQTHTYTQTPRKRHRNECGIVTLFHPPFLSFRVCENIKFVDFFFVLILLCVWWCGVVQVVFFPFIVWIATFAPYHFVQWPWCVRGCAFVVELRFSNIHFFTTTAAHTLVDIENKKKRVDVCVCVTSLRVYN